MKIILLLALCVPSLLMAAPKKKKKEQVKQMTTKVEKSKSREFEYKNMFAVDMDENTIGSFFQRNKTSLRDGTTASKDFTMAVGLTYARRKHEYVQFQISLDATRREQKIQEAKTTTWTYALGLGPIFNFSLGGNFTMKRAWYFTGLFGLEIEGTKTARSSRELNHMWWLVGLGKRFPLTKLFGTRSVVYSPNIAYKNISYDNNSVLNKYYEYNFNILKFDFFFD